MDKTAVLFTRCPHCDQLFRFPLHRASLKGQEVVCGYCIRDFVLAYAEPKAREHGSSRYLMSVAEVFQEGVLIIGEKKGPAFDAAQAVRVARKLRMSYAAALAFVKKNS